MNNEMRVTLNDIDLYCIDGGEFDKDAVVGALSGSDALGIKLW